MRRVAVVIAGTAAAIMLLAPGSASANPMQPWSTGCGVTVPAGDVTTHNPMQPWSCKGHGPATSNADTTASVTIDHTTGQ